MAVKMITYHNAQNYGAVLQSVALFKALKQFDESTCIYDYTNKKIAKSYQLFKLSKSISGNAMQLATLPIKYRKKSLFRQFLIRNATLSSRYDEKDIFITGSDQVWNHRATDFDKTYFLDFVTDNQKKNSYAASFGLSHIEPELIPQYRALLESFHHISVREDRGKELVSEICGRDSVIMPDPVFLLTQEEWEKLACQNKVKGDYILLYLMVKTPTAIQFAKNLSKKTGLPVYFIDNYELKLRKEFHIQRGRGPAEWLSLFLGAKYVITNSFHGTAFSILFNKELFVELLPESFGVNSRLINITEKFGLTNRIINGKEADSFHNEISYDPINAQIQEERIRAFDYLKTIVKGENK